MVASDPSSSYSLGTLKRNIPKPTPMSSVCLLTGIALAFITINPNALPSEMARQIAIMVGIALAASVWCDTTRGLSNLFRVDLVCLAGLYFFTLLEFLFPQERFDNMLNSAETVPALQVLLLAFASLVIGRHFTLLKPISKKWLNFSTIPDRFLFRILLLCVFLGYFHVLLSVNFNIWEAIQRMQDPRFSQPWSRGQLGGWNALLTELSLFRYIIPPVAGILWNRRQSLPRWQLLIVIAILTFTLFQGFTSGTRNIFGSYIAGFLGGYFLTLEKVKLWKMSIILTITSYLMLFATRHMLAFRTMGLRNYLESGAYVAVQEKGELAVDYNLAIIGYIVDAMPRVYDFLGFEMLFVFATKPIPRVFWPDKPLGLSVSIEEIAGANGWTVSTTYVGEAYMIGGITAVIIISLLIGAGSNWWTQIAAKQVSGYGKVVGALGFFVAAMTMRSLAFLTTIMLPIIALIVLARLFFGRSQLRPRTPNL